MLVVVSFTPQYSRSGKACGLEQGRIFCLRPVVHTHMMGVHLVSSKCPHLPGAGCHMPIFEMHTAICGKAAQPLLII